MTMNLYTAQARAPAVAYQSPAPVAPYQAPAPYAPVAAAQTDMSTMLSSIMPLLSLVLVMGLIMPMFKDLSGSMK